MCFRRALTSRNSRDAIGVFLPTLRDLSRKVPSTSQYSSVYEPSLAPMTCGQNLLSALTMYSQVFSVSKTWASASILSMIGTSVFTLVYDRLCDRWLGSYHPPPRRVNNVSLPQPAPMIPILFGSDATSRHATKLGSASHATFWREKLS